MSRQPSATSAQALQVGAAATPARLATDALGEAGSQDALARLNAAMGELKALAVAPMLQRAVQALQKDDHRTADEWALKALEKDERNGFGWYLLAIARERAGDFASSVKAYESALRLIPDHAEVANDLGRLAFRMGLKPQAEKLFRHYLARHPDNPEGANNLACSLREQQRYEEAIDILRPAIEARPDVAMLWNTMGTVVGEQGDFSSAQLFFHEALRLEPDFIKARYNLGNSLLSLGDPEQALVCCEAALTRVVAEDERQMMRLSRSNILMALGRIAEGWAEYEARLDPRFGEVTHFLVNRPRWQPGAELAGKTFLVVGEQGLGDEILFANTLPDLAEALGPTGKLILAVETRLVPLFQRSYPQAHVVAHRTYVLNNRPARAVEGVELEAVDLWTPLASLLRQFRPTVAHFPDRTHQLRADPERVAHWQAELAKLPGRKVGLLWKSAISKNARHRWYSPFEAWTPVLRQPGVTFINLQYGDCSAELAWVKDQLGVEIYDPPGIDLKQDLDDVAALCCAVDLVVGFSNATFNIAAACGTPAWLIATPGAWPRLGQDDWYPWYPQVPLLTPPEFGAWEPLMESVAERLDGWMQAER